MDEAENQINDLEHKEAKNNQDNNKKKNPQKGGQCKQSLEQLQAYQHWHHRGARRRIERRNCKSV